MPIQFPIPHDTFINAYQEKQFLLMRGALKDAPFNLGDVDQILYGTEPTAPFLRVHKGGFVPEESYVEIFNDLGSSRRRIVRHKFYALLREGATMILNRVDNRHPLIRALCLDVAQFTSQHTLANGYAAFGHNASFGKHWDCHDVFAVQLHGRKRWQLFKPTMPLPLSGQTSTHSKADCPAEAELDVILEQGDVLYVPRGWWHCATPIGEETFHVAIGVHPPVITEYFAWLCNTKLPAFLNCRRSLSFDRNNEADVQAALADLSEVAASPENLAEYMRLIGSSDRVQSPFDLRRGIGNAEPALDDEMLVRLNAIYPRQAQEDKPLVINGAPVNVSAEAQPLLAALACAPHRTLRLGQLRAHTSADGGALVRELLEQDLVQLHAAAN